MITLNAALAKYPGAETFRFGDDSDLNAEILALVRAGKKTMTCSAWDAFAAGGEALPETGRVDIALDWKGTPALALRTVKVEKLRFCDMDAVRIPPQGEFADLADWRRGYESCLRREGLFSAEVPLMVETFEVVEDFGEGP